MSKTRLFVKIISIILLAIILLGAVAAILLLQTPQQFGAAQQLYGNYTIEKLGFSEESYWNIFKVLRSVSKEHNADKISPNRYNQNDGEQTDELFANSQIAFRNNPQYRLLFTANAFKSGSAPTVLTEKQLAYAVDSALREFYESTSGSFSSVLISEATEALQKMSVSVTELSFYVQNEKTYLKIVTKIQLSDYASQEKLQTLGVADSVYCTLIDEIGVSSYSFGNDDYFRSAVVKKDFVGAYLNDLSGELGQKALNALFLLVAKNETSALNATLFNTYVFAAVQYLCGHIGDIGTQTQDGTPTINISAIDFDAHTISFVSTFR